MLDDAACLPVAAGVLPVSWLRYLPDANVVDPFHMALITKAGIEVIHESNSDYRRYGRRPLVI